MKIGFYGGSFDPIHNGHLILARDAVEQLGLDRLYFLPSALSPHKLESRPAPASLRLEMVRRAIEDEPRFDVDTFEIEGDGPSYAVETMYAMRERFGAEAELYYLIGRDNLAALPTWRRVEELHRLVRFVVMDRHDNPGEESPLPYLSLHRRLDLSSTEIRNRIANSQSIRYLVPDGVHDLIASHLLYQT